MQGRLWLPATSTHYDHGAQPRSKLFGFFPRGRKIGWSGEPLWHSREPTQNSTHIWPFMYSVVAVNENVLYSHWTGRQCYQWQPRWDTRRLLGKPNKNSTKTLRRFSWADFVFIFLVFLVIQNGKINSGTTVSHSCLIMLILSLI